MNNTTSSELSIQPIRNKTIIERIVYRKLFWVIFCGMAFFVPIVRTLQRELPPELPIFYQVPEFSLKNEMGEDFGSKDLLGRVYVSNFIFTSCPTVCPGMMEKTQIIQKRLRGLGAKVAIVTFTVDPEYDTPQVLFKYSRELQSNPYVWHFLTGEKEKIKKLLVTGFKVPMGEEPFEKKYPLQDDKTQKEVTVFDIVHSEKVVLVDQEGRIRGYYSLDKNSVNKMMIDIGLLVNRKVHDSSSTK